MGHVDIGVHKGDRQLRTPWHRWSSDWALSDAVRALVNYVCLPPQFLAHHANDISKGDMGLTPNGPAKVGGGGLLIA
jgi:hypothetical protein